MELKNVYDEFIKFLTKILNEKDVLCIVSIGKDISFYPSSDCFPSDISIDYIAEIIEYLHKKGYTIFKMVPIDENKVLISFKYNDRVIFILTKKGLSEIRIIGHIKSLFYTKNLIKSN